MTHLPHFLPASAFMLFFLTIFFSHSESLQSLKETVEAQNLAISDLEESLDLIQKSLDNMTESDCTEPEK